MEYPHYFPLWFQREVIQPDIDSSTCPVSGPLVMFIEGVMCRDYGRGKVLTEHGLEYLDYKDESSFEFGSKFHFDPRFLDGVFHDVVMIVTFSFCHQLLNFVLIILGGWFGLVFGVILLGGRGFDRGVFFRGMIWFCNEFVASPKHDADED